MLLTPSVEFIISTLSEKGHRADVVGGPVRDFLRGVTPSDYDITTDATPEEIKAAFGEFRTLDTGIKHGTVTLLLDGEPYEITTYRIDGEYKDSRHPETVSFTKKIEEDLSRRDFTMNAIAYNPKDGITDPHGGREDIKNKIIRAVGDPYLRFSEDALRILRALRFSATLGFEIEERTAEALRAKRGLLSDISAERKYTEWRKLMSGDFAYDVIRKFPDVIAEFIPEVLGLSLPKKSDFAEDFLTRTAQIFALTLGDNAPCAFDTAMRRLKTDTETREMGAKMLENSGKYPLNSLEDAGFMLMNLGERVALATVRLDLSLGLITEKENARVSEYFDRGLPYRISDLAIGGDDLIKIGYSGREVGKLLSELLTLTVRGEISNDKESQLCYIALQKL